MSVVNRNVSNYTKVSSDGCLVIEGAEHLFAVVDQLGGSIRIECKKTGDRFEVSRIRKERV